MSGRQLDKIYQDIQPEDNSDDEYEDALDDREKMSNPISQGGSSQLSFNINYKPKERKEKLTSNIFLIIYLLFAIASLTIGVILEINSGLLASRNYRNYLDNNKFVLYIFIGYQAALILLFSILIYINNYDLIDSGKLLAVSSTFFLINIILLMLEIFNSRGKFSFIQDYILLFLSAGTIIYFISITYGLIMIV